MTSTFVRGGMCGKLTAKFRRRIKREKIFKKFIVSEICVYIHIFPLFFFLFRENIICEGRKIILFVEMLQSWKLLLFSLTGYAKTTIPQGYAFSFFIFLYVGIK